MLLFAFLSSSNEILQLKYFIHYCARVKLSIDLKRKERFENNTAIFFGHLLRRNCGKYLDTFISLNAQWCVFVVRMNSQSNILSCERSTKMKLVKGCGTRCDNKLPLKHTRTHLCELLLLLHAFSMKKKNLTELKHLLRISTGKREM